MVSNDWGMMDSRGATGGLSDGGDWGRRVVIVADQPWGMTDARSAVETAGLPPFRMMDMIEAVEWLEGRQGIDLLFIEIASDGGAVLDRLLDMAARMAVAGEAFPIVAMPRHLIDIVTARISPDKAELLCDPTVIERVAAIGTAIARSVAARSSGVADGDHRRVDHRLQLLSEEVARIARQLAEMSAGKEKGGTVVPAGSGEAGVPPPLADAASIRRMIKARRLRARFFDADLFGEPAWDMLLDLMASGIEGKPVSISSLCIAAAVPGTTALRAIGAMTRAGLFERHADPDDARRVFVRLSPSASIAMARCLAAIAAADRD